MKQNSIFQILDAELKQLRAENEEKDNHISFLEGMVVDLQQEIDSLKNQKTDVQSKEQDQSFHFQAGLTDRHRNTKNNRTRARAIVQNLQKCYTDNCSAWSRCDEIVKTIINSADV